MTTHTTTSIDETPRFPEPVCDVDARSDGRQMAPDTEEGTHEEAGYGYGV